MKATTRPARRMSAARHAALTVRIEAQRQAREAAWQARQDANEQAAHPTPDFTAVPRLTLLPGGLHWSAQVPVPAIGSQVQVRDAEGRPQPAQVRAYGHADGFLAVVVERQQPTGRAARRRVSPRSNFVFGSQLAQAA